ncbi:MAG: hypothetical protein HY895_08335 [Deltaproteobacteria bacterium]|nr:hypothetical protein [Deltaproteobacteria bacterium]
MFWGTFFVCLSVVVAIMAMLGARHPSQPKWASSLMVQYVWGILIVGFIAIGIPLFLLSFKGDAPPITTQEYLLSLAAAAGTAILIKLLGIKKKLTAYAAGR